MSSRHSQQSSLLTEPNSHVRLEQVGEMERNPEPTDTTALIAYHGSNKDCVPYVFSSCLSFRHTLIHGSRFGTIELFKAWFPAVDPQNLQAQGWLRRLSNRDIMLIVHQAMSSIVFLVNLSITISAIKKHGIHRISGDMISGNCKRMKNNNLVLHIAINVLSTLLLGSSNYCAQLLAAPTRQEIDNAHNKKQWFDIGIQSFRNLWKLRPNKRATWLCLMISSGLLHLM